MSEYVIYNDHMKAKTHKQKLYSFIVDPVGHKTSAFVQKCFRAEVEAILHAQAHKLSQSLFRTNKNISIDIYRTSGKTQLQMFRWDDTNTPSMMFFNKNERVRIPIAEIYAVKVTPNSSACKWKGFAHKLKMKEMRQFVKVSTASVPKCVYDLLALEYDKLAAEKECSGMMDCNKSSPDSVMIWSEPTLKRASDIYRYAASVADSTLNSLKFDNNIVDAASQVMEWIG